MTRLSTEGELLLFKRETKLSFKCYILYVIFCIKRKRDSVIDIEQDFVIESNWMECKESTVNEFWPDFTISMKSKFVSFVYFGINDFDTNFLFFHSYLESRKNCVL